MNLFLGRGNTLTPEGTDVGEVGENQRTTSPEAESVGGTGVAGSHNYHVMANSQNVDVGLAAGVSRKPYHNQTLLKASRELYLLRPFTVGADEDGEVAAFLGNFMGITDKVRIERLFRKCNKQLEKHVNNHRNNAMGWLKKMAKGKLKKEFWTRKRLNMTKNVVKYFFFCILQKC